MRSIERRFQRENEKHHDWATLACYERAVAGQRFKPALMHVWFNRLVDKEDYLKIMKKGLYAKFDRLTNRAEDDNKLG
jgi:hypothetical protein